MSDIFFPRVWIRYVDDIFAVVNDVNNFLNKLNCKSESIKFTMEKGNNEQLTFLD